MTQEQKQSLADVYNKLSELIPTPSEKFSTTHAYCLYTIRTMLQEDSDNTTDEKGGENT